MPVISFNEQRDPQAKPAVLEYFGKTAVNNMSYRIMRTLYPVLKLIYPNGIVTSEGLARTIYKCGLHGGPLKILENRDIREYSMRQINEI